MLNVLSVDVEDYFHVEAFAGQVSCGQWTSFAPRVERNVRRILDLFDRHETKATFFILGWVAERFPHLVKEIDGRGHEIACHGFAHQRLLRLTPEQFRADIRRAKDVLSGLSGHPITGYRAPSFSIVKSTLWAFDILAEEGFKLDSSVFPVHHDFYGIPDAPRGPYWYKTPGGSAMFEFPPSTVRVMKGNIGIAGGGYLRFAPYFLTQRGIRHINQEEKQPAMVYFHPWEIDPDQPRIHASFRSRLRHYTNLSRMERKLERLLQDFRFTTLSKACEQLAVYRAGL
jgi:polysaccharide deacetylase family protein (PEP-CTERM system associated)